MQAGSAKGAAEDLKSAIIGYMMFADGMVQTLPKMPTNISEVGLWLHACPALPPPDACPFTVLLQ